MTIAHRTTARAIAMALFAGILTSCFVARSEEDPGSADKKPETEEEKEDKSTDAERKKEIAQFEAVTAEIYEGKVALNPVQKDDPKPRVIGTFTLNTGKIFLLRLNASSSRESLEPYDGKVAVLRGEIRNEGKYFYVNNVVARPTPGRRNKLPPDDSE